ncbi:MAG: SurA N-terminal domain-containing protein, partial [Phycisphaerae bacterium]|nr:SurA N-terminal domain-containing protein [Phycisphaerae bacterium]
MAFKFFRRRQKMVLIVMVLLMVAFLVPTLFQSLGGGRGRDSVIGYINDEKVTIQMQQAAEVDLTLLSRSLGIGRGRRTGEGAFAAFWKNNQNQNAGLAWMLLLHEARNMGITIEQDDPQVESFLTESGLTGEAYRRELANLRENRYTEEHLRQAVANYLMVITAFQAAEINIMSSLPELRHVFGDLKERIGLAMVAFPAKDFTAEAPEPSGEAVFRQFEQYKHLFSQGPENMTDFGFGYRLPDRLDIAWLFIDEGLVADAVEPLHDDMTGYWEKHKGELKKRIPADDGQAPATSTAPSDTKPTEPAEEKFREVVIESFSQAKPQIRRILMPKAID